MAVIGIKNALFTRKELEEYGKGLENIIKGLRLQIEDLQQELKDYKKILAVLLEKTPYKEIWLDARSVFAISNNVELNIEHDEWTRTTKIKLVEDDADQKRKALEADGWRFGEASDFVREVLSV